LQALNVNPPVGEAFEEFFLQILLDISALLVDWWISLDVFMTWQMSVRRNALPLPAGCSRRFFPLVGIGCGQQSSSIQVFGCWQVRSIKDTER